MVPKCYRIKGPFPPTISGVESTLRNRGFQPDPILAEQKGSFRNFVKPLPNGERIHIQVRNGREYLQIESHIDEFDPKRSMIGHFFESKKAHCITKIRKRKDVGRI
jgi:hypothetical protein